MKPAENILSLLNQHPEALSRWGYEAPMELSDGLSFSVCTTAYHPGWVRVTYEETEGAYFIRAAEEEYGFVQEVGFVQELNLFETLDKVIQEGLSIEEIEDIRRRWFSVP